MMSYEAGTLVEVFDGDADAWFSGWVEGSDEMRSGPWDGERYWIVRLDAGPVQFERTVSVMAVPFSRPEWIRSR